MTSDNQILANRRNAQKSTGPRTASGKRRSRRNAFRHGLTAIAIVETVEDAADYERFERKINADYSPVTGVECALVARLASLLWRLRRAVACESGLLQIESGTRQEPKVANIESGKRQIIDHEAVADLAPFPFDKVSDRFGSNPHIECPNLCRNEMFESRRDVKLVLAKSFLRLATSEPNVFERLGRYEASLWRQAAQTICLLDSIKTTALSADNLRGRRLFPKKQRAHPYYKKRFF